MKIGKQITFRPDFPGTAGKTVTGIVVWQHPKGRYILVEYHAPALFGERKIRECLQIVGGRIVT
jgi:hypothetical protein